MRIHSGGENKNTSLQQLEASVQSIKHGYLGDMCSRSSSSIHIGYEISLREDVGL